MPAVRSTWVAFDVIVQDTVVMAAGGPMVFNRFVKPRFLGQDCDDAAAQAGEEAPLAIGGSPDVYLLGTQLASAVMAEGGWRNVNLGAQTPLQVLAQTVETLRPSRRARLETL